MTTLYDEEPKRARAVVVLGMHRSGTSVLSRALITLGIDFGGSFIEPEHDNPKGFFEDRDLNKLNATFLKKQGYYWHSLIFPKSFEPSAEVAFKKQASTLLIEKFSQKSLWGLKEPRITRLLPLWESAISETQSVPFYILANRNPLSVADSLAKRDSIPTAHALALWALHQVEGLSAIIRNGGIVVDYDVILREPAKELDRIARYVKVDVDENERCVFLDDFLDPALRHSQYDQLTSSESELTSVCLDFHTILNRLAHEEAPLGDEQIAEAGQAIRRVKCELDVYHEWFESVDSAWGRCEQLRVQSLAMKAKMAKLQSRIAWAETPWAVRFFKRHRQVG